MGQFVHTNGDYNIKAGVGAKIVLDTGPASSGGQTIVTGDLTVLGQNLTIETTNLTLTDNIITLNSGEVGPGVTLRYSGIQVIRSQDESSPSASVVWDEASHSWNFVTGVPGAYNFSNSTIKTSKVTTNSTTDAGDLTLIGTGTGVVKVAGCLNYQDQVTDDDDIPNKKYVDDSIQNNPTFQILKDNTRVIITDADVLSGPGSEDYLTSVTGWNTGGLSAVSMIADGQLSAQFYSSKIYLQDLTITGNSIANTDSGQHLNLVTYGTGKVTINSSLQFDQVAGSVTAVSGKTIIYGAAPSVGTTGVYYSNTSTTGELISKNKALLFSMLF